MGQLLNGGAAAAATPFGRQRIEEPVRLSLQISACDLAVVPRAAEGR